MYTTGTQFFHEIDPLSLSEPLPRVFRVEADPAVAAHDDAEALVEPTIGSIPPV